MEPEATAARRRFDLLATTRGRRVLFAALYFSEGAPIGYVWWALPTRLRDAGVPIEQVTALSALLTIPWTLKFLWAPLIDSLRPRRLGLRAWIIGAQIAMGLSLIPVARIPIPEGYELLLGFLLVHAFCAATQDVSVDALAIASIPSGERGVTTGVMQVAMVMGRATFGGVALALERKIGGATVIYLLVAAVWSSALLVAFGAHGAAGGSASGSIAVRFQRFRSTFAGVFRMPQTWMGFAIACLAGAGMEATGTVAGPLLIDRGWSKEAVGQFFAMPAVICMATGALVGGNFSDRLRREGALAISVCLLALAVVGVGAATTLGTDAGLLAALSVTYFCFGAFTAASYALYMELTNPALGGTQFSAFMGAVNLCSVWSAWVVGRLVARFDYSLALSAMAAASLLALPLILLLHARRARWSADWANEIREGEHA